VVQLYVQRPSDAEGPIKTLRGQYKLLYGGNSRDLKAVDYKW
jgi:hypothetical protein